MKYIVRYLNTEYGHAMYMIANGVWTRNILDATIHNDKDSAINLAEIQYPRLNDAWHHITILEYTDREYFKAVLKG